MSGFTQVMQMLRLIPRLALQNLALTNQPRKMSKPLSDADYILNKDGSVYHIHLRNEHIADDVIVVGDQGRVKQITKHFDHIEVEIHNREFVTHTGTLGKKRITVMSTGIGTDNVDIAINELDAAVNIDPESRMAKVEKRKLKIIRIGTSGALQADIPVGSQVISQFGLGFDGVMHYYSYESNALERLLEEKIAKHLDWSSKPASPYICNGSAKLFTQLGKGMIPGITASSPGFYGPQGRMLRLSPRFPAINDKLGSFVFENYRITNFEMETSALYGLCNMLGHDACTVCAIIANRVRKEFSEDYKKDVERLIETVLARIG